MIAHWRNIFSKMPMTACRFTYGRKDANNLTYSYHWFGLVFITKPAISLRHGIELNGRKREGNMALMDKFVNYDWSYLETEVL